MSEPKLCGQGRWLMGDLLLPTSGLVGLEAIVGFFWADLVPLDVPAVLVGTGIIVAAVGLLSLASGTVGIRWPRAYRWILGLGMGVILPLKLGVTRPSVLVVTGALTALAVVFVSARLNDGDAARGLSVLFLLLVLIGDDWFGPREASAALEIVYGGSGAVLLGAILLQLSGGVPDFAARRPRMVSAVVLVVFAGGLILWSTVETRREDPSYFSGTVPEVQGSRGGVSRDMPNIILISVDTLRADRVPPRADTELHVPNLRDLMDDSIRLTNVFSSSSWTLPGHASLFTGLPPMAHGAVNPERSRIYDSVPTYVQMLRKLGYQTAAFTDGGYVSDQFGFGRGFGRYQSSYGTGGLPSETVEPGIQSLGRRLHGVIASASSNPPEGTKPGEYNYFWQNLRAAEEWLSRKRESDRPFFMFLHTYQAHDYMALYPRSMHRLRAQNSELARAASSMGGLGSGFRRLDAAQKKRLHHRLKTVSDSPVKSSLVSIATLRPRIWNVLESWVLGLRHDEWKAFLQLSPEGRKKVLFRASTGAHRWGVPALPNLRTDYRRTSYLEWLGSTFDLPPDTVRRIGDRNRLKMEGLEWLYDDLVEDVDRSLGNFIDHLRSKDLYDDTLIVFLSDHGEGFSWSPLLVDHGFRTFLDGRGQLNDAVTHVPVWIKPSSAFSSGRICEERFQLRDVFPIVLRELGVKLPDSAPTGELVRPRKGSGWCPRSRRSLVKGSVTQRKPWLKFSPRFYVRGDKYRLEVQRDPRAELFWEVDGGESDRRVSTSAVPEVDRERLRAAMKEYLRRFDEHPDPYQLQAWEADEDLEEELRGLGYL